MTANSYPENEIHEDFSGDYVFQLPWPPSMNTYWRHVVMGKSARTMISKKGREYRERAAGWLLRQALVNEGLSSRLAVHIHAYPPDKRARDLDNLPKSVLDAITAAEFWLDDSQIDDLRITRGHVVKQGLLVITVNHHQPGALMLCAKIELFGCWSGVASQINQPGACGYEAADIDERCEGCAMQPEEQQGGMASDSDKHR